MEKFNCNKIKNEFNDQIFSFVKKGCISSLEEIIKKGWNLNIRDNQQKTPLIWAALLGHKKIVKLLIKAKSDLNLCDCGGYNALQFATGRTHNKIAQILLDNGAIIKDTMIFSAQTNILYHLKIGRYSYFESLFEKIAPKIPFSLKTFKAITLIKAIAHSNDLGGKIIVRLLFKNARLSIKINSFIKLEGGWSLLWLHKMQKATALVMQNCPYILPEKGMTLLKETLLFGSNLNNTSTPPIILKRIKEGLPIILVHHFPGHVVAIFIKGKDFILCNAGDGCRGLPIEIFHYDQEKINEEILQLILKHSASREAYETLFFKTLQNHLSFKKECYEEIFEHNCRIKQPFGNCSWKCLEIAVWAFWIGQVREEKGPWCFAQEILLKANKCFNSWLVLNQLYHLERYMNVYCLRKVPKETGKNEPYELHMPILKRAFENVFSFDNVEIFQPVATLRKTLYKHYNDKLLLSRGKIKVLSYPPLPNSSIWSPNQENKEKKN